MGITGMNIERGFNNELGTKLVSTAQVIDFPKKINNFINGNEEYFDLTSAIPAMVP
jgi:hypothetical protein